MTHAVLDGKQMVPAPYVNRLAHAIGGLTPLKK